MDPRGEATTDVESELATQPDCWRRAVDHVASGRLPLPAWTARVAAIGCGTSRFVAAAYASLRQASGGETDAFAASELPERRYDVIVALSRSGTTTEVVRALRAVGGGIPTVAITATPGSPVTALADRTVVLDWATERSVVQTRFATTALALLRASLGHPLGAAIADADDALDAPLPPVGAHPQHLVFLGTGWAGALAEEAALKCREAAGAHTEAHLAMEYRHGPISAAGPDTLVWALDPLPPGLHDEIAATGARIETSGRDPMGELVRIQRYAVAGARAAGRDPDHPRALAYSVVLDR